MRKILTIAAREYRAMVATKAFLISIVMMPVLMGGGIIAMKLLQENKSIEDKKLAIIDHTGYLYPQLEVAAAMNNEMLEKMTEDGSREDRGIRFSEGIRYELEQVDTEGFGDDQRIALSERVKSRDLFAFVEIPADVTDAERHAEVNFHSQDSGLSEARGWLRGTITEFVKKQRLEEAGLDPIAVGKATQSVPVKGLGLVEKSAEGEIMPATEKDELTAIFLPLGVMMLMFMVIFLAAQPMLESVLEEKSQRIAEVLLGSANPTQLMTGKLMGTVAGSLTVFVIYFGGLYFVANKSGWIEKIPFEIAPWFIVFQILGVLLYAAIFMAVGASVSQLKEAQSMLLPVWMLMMAPMFVWIQIVQEPNNALSQWFSLFPPATPTTMVLRMATGATIPLWQPLVGIVLLVLTTMLVVFVAGRIFRVGILWQGKTPKITELLRWAFQG